MKTLVLFHDVDSVYFFEMEGDFSHLNDVFVGSLGNSNEELLSDLLWDQDGRFKHKKMTKPSKDWDFFITVGLV